MQQTVTILRLGLAASAAVVVGSSLMTSVQFLAVTTTALTIATTTLVSAWCVPVLIKSAKCF